MARSGQLSKKEWDAMMTGELPEEAKYPAGNLGSHMISTEQRLFIDKEIQAYEHVVVENAEATVLGAAVSLRSKIMNSEDDTPIEELQADKDNMLLRMERMGLQNTEEYKDLVNTDPTLNNREASIAILQDNYAYKRNINIYALSEDTSNNLIRTPTIIKNNLKSYLNINKMINDSIDILDAHVVNIGINFTIVSQTNVDKHDALVSALSHLKKELMTPKMNIGEPFYVTEVYRILKEVDEVLDVVDVKIINKTSTSHSGVYYNIKQNTSDDGRIINSKENICFEIKFGDDIKGAVI